jgi:universal stress protein E
MKLERILVALKPWERGLPLAANHARQLSQGVNGHIELVSTVFDAAVAAGRDRGETVARLTQDRTVAVARVELERLARSVRDLGATITTKVVWGVPSYEGILNAADECGADLLVVGAHEPHTPHTRLTDTDWQLMRRVSCPLLLVKNPVFRGYRVVLAGVDSAIAHDKPRSADRTVLDAGRCFALTFGSILQAERSTDAVIDFAVERKADLVVVGNMAEAIAATVPCDVLIVPTVAEASSRRLSQIG